MKLIIDIPDIDLNIVKNGSIMSANIVNACKSGKPFDDLRAEIEQNAYPIVHGVNNHEKGMTLYGILQVLDNIGKESEGKENGKNE